jgi:hypothetical protein
MTRSVSVAEVATPYRRLVFKVGKCSEPLTRINLTGRSRPGPVVTVAEMTKTGLAFAHLAIVVQSLY